MAKQTNWTPEIVKRANRFLDATLDKINKGEIVKSEIGSKNALSDAKIENDGQAVADRLFRYAQKIAMATEEIVKAGGMKETDDRFQIPHAARSISREALKEEMGIVSGTRGSKGKSLDARLADLDSLFSDDDTEDAAS